MSQYRSMIATMMHIFISIAALQLSGHNTRLFITLLHPLNEAVRLVPSQGFSHRKSQSHWIFTSIPCLLIVDRFPSDFLGGSTFSQLILEFICQIFQLFLLNIKAANKLAKDIIEESQRTRGRIIKHMNHYLNPVTNTFMSINKNIKTEQLIFQANTPVLSLGLLSPVAAVLVFDAREQLNSAK